jgi:hypothetical protein
LALHGRGGLAVLLALLGVFALAAQASSASAAEFGIPPGGFAVRMLDAEGNPELRSGSHPDRLQIDFALEVEGTGTSARDLVFEMPAGFGGNLDAVAKCSRQAYGEGVECPPDTQVGVVNFGSSGGPGAGLPIFQLEPAAGQVAAFASKPGIEIPFTMELRPGDYGITLKAGELTEGAPSEGQIELWGVPADHQEGAPAQRRPFLTTPSVCGPLVFTFRTRSQEEGAPWLSANSEAGPLSGCESLAFAPKLGLQLSNPVADSPTGLRMELSLPEEEEGADELAGAEIKDVTVGLSPGLTISPGGASGLTVCSDAQLDLGSSAAATCPSSSRVGTTEFSAAALPEPLAGTVYLGQAQGAERFRLFVVAPGPGIVLKFITALHLDPLTGGLSASLRNLPQVAISQITMSLDGGPTGLLASPLGCGPARGTAKFVPYGGGLATQASATLAIATVLPGLTCPGPLPFAPELRVGGSSHRAGRPSSFSAVVQRRDGEQLPARFAVALPAGLSAGLGAVHACPEPAAAAGACPAGSRVGSARAVVGSGQSLAVLNGGAYLAGPYRRAPFSLVIALRAAIGPFDLGTIAFRAAAQIDGRTGRVTVTTDRLPDLVEGIAVRFRAIEFDLDRSGLVRNPTSCTPHTVDATVEAQGGASVALASPFPVGGCKKLGFRPRVRLALANGRRLRKHAGIGLRVAAHLRPGDTNLRALELSLPPAFSLEISKLKEICSRRDATAGLCPMDSRVGTASARTALLSEPLKGSIYVVQPEGNGQPDLSVSLAAMGVHLSVRGTTANDHGRFVTRLAGLPDMPLSDFTMRLGGGGESLLSLGVGPCLDGRPRRLEAGFSAAGQDGAQRSSRLPIAMKPSCGAPAKR